MGVTIWGLFALLLLAVWELYKRRLIHTSMLIIESAPSIAEKSADVHDALRNPENGVPADVEGKGKGKDTAVDISEVIAASGTSSDTLEVDWTEYEPPEGLRFTGDMESDIITQVIQESIDRIKARIREREEQRKAIAEAASREQEVAIQGSAKAEQPEPDSLVDGDSGPVGELQKPEIPEEDAPSVESAGAFPAELPKRPRKRTLMKLFRKLNSGPEHGESSAAGAARHRLLTSLYTAESTTHSTRKRFVLDLIKKATGEDNNSGPSAPEAEVECVSCLDDFDPKDTVRAPCHHYCTPCFQRLVASACQNETHWPPKCCLNAIPESTILANVDAAQRAEYRERAREWNVPVADRIYCARAGCSELIRPEYVIAAQSLARCTRGHYTCTVCRNPQHEGDGATCPADRELARTRALAEEEGWQRCHGCAALVEHRDACQHMTCRCGAEFCYVCGARWRTCACSMAQLVARKDAAAARRTERAREEAAEEAAVAEALRLVAEFEREEELKAELLRQEQERLAEERRRAQLEARILRESERRRAVMLKFEALRATLRELHATQYGVVRGNHEKRGAQLAQKSGEVVRRLAEAHALERELQRAKTEARIARREENFRAEYVARVAEERAIEEQYAAKLEAFWGRRKNGGEKMREALGEFKVRMEEGFQEWKKWMDVELEAYRHHVREEQAIGEELMDEKERRLSDRVREAGEALARRNAAEMRWVREVVEERARLLEELEADEIENGEDIDTWFAEGPLEEVLVANPWEQVDGHAKSEET